MEEEGIHLVTSIGALKKSSFTSVGVGGHPNSISFAHDKIQV